MVSFELSCWLSFVGSRSMLRFRGKVTACRTRVAAVLWEEEGGVGLIKRVDGGGRMDRWVDAFRLREGMLMLMIRG